MCGVDGSWFRQKLGISVFIKTAPVAKMLSWQQHQGCHVVSFVMNIYGAKFQDHCLNISRDVVYSVCTTFQLQYYDIITDQICILEKTSISLKRKKDISKRKTPFFGILKGLSNIQKIFFCVIYTLSDSNEFVAQLQIFRNSAQLYPRCHRFFLCGFHCLYCDPREECFSRGFAARAGSRWSETKYFLISAHRAREKKKPLVPRVLTLQY